MGNYDEHLLNRDSAIPLYYQIKDILEKQLDSGELKPGDLLEPEGEIAAKLKVSRSTIRQAILELVNQKRFYRVPGKGTFVSDVSHTVTRGFPGLTSFTEDVRRSGNEPGSELISFEFCKEVTKDVVKHLQLDSADDPVVRIRRRMLVNDECVGFHEVYLPQPIWDRMNVKPGELHNVSLYLLMENAGIALYEAVETINVQRASREIAKYLELKVGDPLLVANRVAYTEDEEPVEYAFNIYRPDRYTYRIRHKR